MSLKLLHHTLDYHLNKMIKKILITSFLILLTLSLYANFLQNEIISSRNELSDPDTTSYGKGIPISFKSGKYTLKGNLLVPKTSGRKFPVIIFIVGSGFLLLVQDYRLMHQTILNFLTPCSSRIYRWTVLHFYTLTKEE